MKYRFVEQVATGTNTPTRPVVGWVVLAVFVLVVVAAAANWARGPQETPQGAQHVAGPVQPLVAMPAPALPDFYRCGDGFEAYRVQLSDADRAVIEGMVAGSVQLPWRVTGCDGLTDGELERRGEGGQ